MLESMTQAMRHVAFIVPAGLGVQEAGFVFEYPTIAAALAAELPR